MGAALGRAAPRAQAAPAHSVEVGRPEGLTGDGPRATVPSRMSRGFRRWGLGVFCLGWLLWAASAASAATITVTRTDDPDNGTGDCIAADTNCSLREAVNTADGNSMVTVISVPAGTYQLVAQPMGA